jgi:pimeloyl-ACP methyl ester carboxylesterase
MRAETTIWSPYATTRGSSRLFAERAGLDLPDMPRVTLASGLTLECEEQGDPAGSAVVLLPGPTDSWRSYQPCLDLLPDDLRVVSVSQRGHGESDKPDTAYGVADFADDVVILLDALGIDDAVIAGHSGSCFVARKVALDHPDRVMGLVLEASPATLRDDPLLLELVESTVSQLVDPISRDFARSFVTATSSDDLAPDLLNVLIEDLVKVPARVWKETFAQLLRYDDTAELSLIEAPTLLVWGDQDTLVSREAQDYLVRVLPDAHLLVYPGAGHTPRWDDPVRFSNDVTAFARRT